MKALRKKRQSPPEPSVMTAESRSLGSRPLPFGGSSRVHDLLPALFTLLLSVACGGLLLPLLRLPFSLSLLLFSCLAGLLLAFLITRYRLPVLILLAVTGMLGLLAFLFPQAFLIKIYSGTLLELADKWWAWWAVIRGQGTYPALDFRDLSAITVFLAGFLVSLGIRLPAASVVMLALASAAYGAAESIPGIDAGPWSKYYYLAAILAGFFFLAQGSRSGRRSGKSRGKDFHERSSPALIARRNWSVLVALLMVLTAGLADFALPDHFFTSQRLHQAITDIVEGGRGGGGQADTYLDFSLQALGYQPLPTRLGGTALPDTDAYLTIETDGLPVWLKGSSRLRYTGQSWLAEGMNPRWLFNGEESTDPQELYIGVRHQSEHPVMRQTARNVRLTIIPRRPQQVLFHGGRPSFFRHVNDRPPFNAYFNRAGSLYLDQEIPRQGYTLLGQALLPLYLETGEAIHLFIDNYHTEADLPVLPAEVRKVCLELPELPGLEDQVFAFDQRLHALLYERDPGMADPAVIEGIVKSLSSGLTYSLEAEIPEEGDEFVGWFLGQGKGYCTFFATAVTVMARQAGIPARYVEGFLVPATEPGKKTRQTLTGERAHAWAELWLEGIGWIPVDATPADTLRQMARTDYVTGLAPGETEPPQPSVTQPTRPMVTETTTLPADDEAAGGFICWSGLPRVLRLLIYLLPLWAFLIWRQYAFFRRHDEKSQGRRIKRIGRKRFLQDLARSLFTLWALDGRPRLPHESVRTYISRVEAARYQTFPRRLIAWQEQLLYAPPHTELSLDQVDLRQLLDFYREEELYLRGALGFRQWFLRRWLTSFEIKQL